MSAYHWNCGDGDAMVSIGTNGVNWVGVIQADDGYGGYNCEYTIVGGQGGKYHVHFKAGSRRVVVLRYKGGSDTNIIKLKDKQEPSNFRDLARECGAFPNHAALFNNLRNATPAM
ncbi:MAG: hypothetical protein JNK60_13700 [Acidobacteria bacterium]|nr:hypothetical protein [Acidobacteriota bacterium]